MKNIVSVTAKSGIRKAEKSGYCQDFELEFSELGSNDTKKVTIHRQTKNELKRIWNVFLYCFYEHDEKGARFIVPFNVFAGNFRHHF